MTRSSIHRRSFNPFLALLIFSSLSVQYASAKRIIQSTSLNPCMTDSGFTATLFNVSFTPDNRILNININGVSSLNGNVTASLQVIAYGYTALSKTISPCEMDGFGGMCPMSQGQITIESQITIEESVSDQIPGIAYQVPDLDGVAKIIVNSTDTGLMVACVEAPLSNGQTVNQVGVGWATAFIAGIGLVASAITSGLGHSNTAAHVAANALSLFGYFQAQAMIGMTAVTLPPIVQAWTQNFEWSMGIIHIGFMQNIFNWYIQATGGTPSTLLNALSDISVQIAKRSVEESGNVMSRAAMYGFELYGSELSTRDTFDSHPIFARTNNENSISDTSTVVKVSGIERVSFKAKIEETNFFMTGLSFFVAFLFLVAFGVCAFKWIFEFCVKMQWMKGSKFLDFRNGWLTVLKGIMYRLVLIGFPQMAVLCLWELTVRDSAGAVVLAIFFFFSMLSILGWAAFKVIRIAQRSVALHKNPAYILYSDPAALNRWGFLYVQFRATAYYYVVPLLLYTLVKAMFIAFGQKSGTVQAIALVLIEAIYLIAVSIMKPWMDKRTNIFNISICSINFINVIFLLVFTNIFNAPGLVTGVMGVIFFVMNAVFALVLLILVLISSSYALMSKNPDVRYQPMRDDRASFIKSNSHMLASTELDALGVAARGDMKASYKTRDLEDDEDSYTTGSLSKQQIDASGIPLPPSTANSRAPSHREMTGSPVETSVPLFPTTSNDGSRSFYANQTGSPTHNQLPLLSTSSLPRAPSRGENRSPAPTLHSPVAYDQGQQYPSYGYQRRNDQPINWQVGAGYEH
ncbi:putative flavin carrier protein 3 [Rhizina undulata]